MNNRNREHVLHMLLAIEAVKEAVEKFEQGEVNLADTISAITRALSASPAAASDVPPERVPVVRSAAACPGGRASPTVAETRDGSGFSWSPADNPVNRDPATASGPGRSRDRVRRAQDTRQPAFGGVRGPDRPPLSKRLRNSVFRCP